MKKVYKKHKDLIEAATKTAIANKQTKLINYRIYNLDKSKIIPIDRRSIFGNPFKIGENNTRKGVIEKYKIWFYNKIKTDKNFKTCVNNLKGKTLGCWCTPLPCHGDVIIEYLNGLKTEGLENENETTNN